MVYNTISSRNYLWWVRTICSQVYEPVRTMLFASYNPLAACAEYSDGKDLYWGCLACGCLGGGLEGWGRMQGTVLWTLYREIGFLSVSGVPCVLDASWRSFHGSGFVRESSIITFSSLFHDCITFWGIEPSCISVVEILKITWTASVDPLELTAGGRGHGPSAAIGHFVRSLPTVSGTRIYISVRKSSLLDQLLS